MSQDNFLIVVTSILAVLGGVVSAHAPQTRRHKWLYIAAFIMLGIVAAVLLVGQSRQNGVASATLSANLGKLQAANEKLLATNNEIARVQDLNTKLQNRLLDLSKSVAFPLHGAIQAHVSLAISGRLDSVRALADMLHSRAFPNGKQAFGFVPFDELDPNDPLQGPLARLVMDLIVNFVFCSGSNCAFEGTTPGLPQHGFRHGASRGVDLIASVPLGPGIPPAMPISGPLTLNRFKLSDRVHVSYNVTNDQFELLLHSEPLQFVELMNVLPDSEKLPHKYLFVELPGGTAGLVVEQIALHRSDNRWLRLESLTPMNRPGGSVYFRGRLASRWM